MKKIFVMWALAALALLMVAASSSLAIGQTPTTTAGPAAAQTRVVGEVASVDASARQVTVKTDEGQLIAVKTDDKTAILRLPPGETAADKAVKIRLEDVATGDRLFARGNLSADNQSVQARQLVVTGKAAGAQQQSARSREDWARRGVNGRITAIDAAKKEIKVSARTREGAGTILIAANSNVRVMRYAPDSARVSDALPASFAELKVGDQIRALGERSADGLSLTAEEIVVGSFQRVGGTITSINAAAGELTIKDNQAGGTLTVSLGKRSALRRIPPEMVAELEQRRTQVAANTGPGASGGANGAQQPTQSAERRDGNGRRGRDGGGGGGAGGGGRQRAGGRNIQEMLQNLPAITLNDLKTGDAVFIVGSPTGTSASRLTAVTLITGEAGFLNLLQRQGGRPNRDRQPDSPGLPGDVIGGGTGNRDQP
ncbi:MAG TPA: hypothetical protein VGB17_05705 [Pyrinomonadaceae bacterium]